MKWQDNLKPSGVALIQEILDQIPAGIMRDTFEGLLNKIAGGESKGFRFYIVDEDGDTKGTNDEEQAKFWAQNEMDRVIDVQQNLLLPCEGLDAEVIPAAALIEADELEGDEDD